MKTPATPAQLALERLARMAASGAKPGRMAAAIDATLVEWTAEELPDDDLRERIEVLQSDIDDGITSAQDYVAEADTEKAVAAARRQLDALTEAQGRLADIIGR